MATGLRRPARAGRGGRRSLLLVTLVAVLIVLINIATGGKIAALVRDAVSPISSVGGRMGAVITRNGYFSTRGQLESQIAALQAEVQNNQLQSAAFQVLQQENQSLSALEHVAATSPGLAAPVTSSIVSSPYGTFTVGAGSADGVTQNSLVLAPGNFVIGTVTQVQAHQSLVTETFAPGAHTDVVIDSAAVTANGSGGEAEADVPHGVMVSVGDPAIAPGFGQRAIGTVAHVDSNPANAEQAVYISLPVSLDSLAYVYLTP